MKVLKQKLQKLQNSRFDRTGLMLWIVRRKLDHSTKQALYEVLWVDTDDIVKTKLAGFVRKKISEANDISPYQYITSDQDGTALTIDVNDTDFSVIEAVISTGSSAPQVESPEQLIDAWGYVIEIPCNGSADRVLAFTRLTGRWKSKNVNFVEKLCFRSQRLEDLQEDSVFTIEKGIDCVAFGQTLFILHKKNFEQGLNFRTGMVKNSKKAVDELISAGVVSNRAALDAEVEKGNTRVLRRLASIIKDPKFRDPGFITKVRELNNQYGWNLTFVGDSIVINDETLHTVLVLLQDKRMISLIERKMFDAEVAREVEGSSVAD